MMPRPLPMLALLLSLGACSLDEGASLDAAQQDEGRGLAGEARQRNQLLPIDTELVEFSTASNPERNAYYGDLHVHTGYSFDAYAFGTTTTPAEAYEYARGKALTHPGGFEVQLAQPLDFYAVTDHAMFLGLVKEAADTGSEFSRYPVARGLHDINAPDNYGPLSLIQRGRAFADFVPATLEGLLNGEIDPKLVQRVSRRAWAEIVNSANEAYVPGHFTTFAGFEYTSSTDSRGNLHRNVIFRDTDRLPATPFSRFNSQNPEGLWQWMDGLREQGVESLAIPHNSNGSNGQMFKLENWGGQPIDDAYAAQRLRNEPLVEITQVKGTSETHPLLSPNDEWADFEIAPYRVATKLPSEPSGGYVRDALLRGLSLAERGVLNPYRFGLIGSSDTHTGAISQDENGFFSKAGLLDATPDRRGSVPAPFLYGTYLRFAAPGLVKEVGGRTYLASSSFEYWSASGLAAVWAEENTREAIYAAFRRKETFATSGPRIRLRFFAGYGLDTLILDDPALVRQAYDGGVSMGGELAGLGDIAPGFLAWAVADADGAPLQRLQIIKGWLENGEHRERVYDVACSDGSVDPSTHRCSDNGARVDLSDCSISRDRGAAELKTRWQDPDFQPGQDAFYYLRALENPVCRWSTWDALHAGVEPRPDLPATIQERAWSSPIWYRPR